MLPFGTQQINGGLNLSWITDVANGQQILSTWGNNIRNRIVQTFADITEANAYVGTVPDGAFAHIAATGKMMRKSSGAWQFTQPLVINPGPVNSGGYYLTPSQFTTIFNATIPPGYSFAHHVVIVSGGHTNAGPVQCKIWHSGGGFLVSQNDWRNADSLQRSNTAFGCWPCNPAGEAVVIQAINTSAIGDWSVSGNPGYTNYCLTLYP